MCDEVMSDEVMSDEGHAGAWPCCSFWEKSKLKLIVPYLHFYFYAFASSYVFTGSGMEEIEQKFSHKAF